MFDEREENKKKKERKKKFCLDLCVERKKNEIYSKS